MTRTTKPIEQFQGCLLGCAVGDAVGAPVEGEGPESIALYIDKHVAPRDFTDIHHKHGDFQFGQYTDDTQLTRELALSLIEHGCLNPQDFGDRLATLFKTKTIVGFGGATYQAAKKLMAKTPWDKAGTPPPRAGNGSAMRAGPIGLFYHARTSAELATAAAMQGSVTHTSPKATAGAVAIAGAVALLLVIDKLRPTTFLGTLSSLVLSFDEEFSEHIWDLGQMHNQSEENILAWCRELQKADPRPWPGISPYVVPSVLWSLYSFIRHPDDFWEAITTAIRPGGDVDTTAAMTGALSGTHLGIQGIPEKIACTVNDRGESGYEFLKDLGTRLWDSTQLCSD